ncbi:MAG: hypothetical protein IPJ65_07045 [Archangiaceae bacterium]|nr:hypothetical protein [Archangiaceae bacterium]
MSPARLIAVAGCAAAGGASFLIFDRWAGPTVGGCTLPAETPEQAQVRVAKAQLLAGELEGCRTIDALRAVPRSDVEALAVVCVSLRAQRAGLDEARGRVEQHDFDGAARALARVPRDSVFEAQVSTVQAQLTAEASRRLEAASEALTRAADEASVDAVIAALDGVERLDPKLEQVRQVRARASEAAAAIVAPWAEVQRAFDGGDRAKALRLAKACAPRSELCQRGVEPLSRLVEYAPRGLKAAELKEQLKLARQISDHEKSRPRDDVSQALASQYEAEAQRCRQQGDWQCVDRQLAAAEVLHVAFTDFTLQAGLNAHVRDLLAEAYRYASADPVRARALLTELAAFTQLDAYGKELAAKARAHLRKGE